MAIRYILLALAFLLYAALPASAEELVVQTCGTLPLPYASGATRYGTVDINGNTCIAGTFSQTGGTISNATSGQATTSTNQGSVSYNYGFNGTTWDQMQVDASKNLKVNCTVGCSGGTVSNATSGVATSATNLGAVAYLYAWNGATWDQVAKTANGLKVDGSAVTQPVSAAAAAIANGASVAQGSTTDTPCTLPASATACSQVAVEKAIANAANSPPPLGTAGGVTPSILNALSTTVKAIKSSAAGQLYMLQCGNTNASEGYVQVFDVATAGGVTLGTTTPKMSIPIAATNTGGFSMPLVGFQFANGIQVAATTTATGSTALGTALDCNAGFN